eukprot:5793814-Amphidinium_carterae.1
MNITTQYARDYHARVAAAVPPFAPCLPDDVTVPYCNPAELLSHEVAESGAQRLCINRNEKERNQTTRISEAELRNHNTWDNPGRGFAFALNGATSRSTANAQLKLLCCFLVPIALGRIPNCAVWRDSELSFLGGKCTIEQKADGTLQRLVSLVVVKLFRQDEVFVQLGVVQEGQRALRQGQEANLERNARSTTTLTDAIWDRSLVGVKTFF